MPSPPPARGRSPATRLEARRRPMTSSSAARPRGRGRVARRLELDVRHRLDALHDDGRHSSQRSGDPIRVVQVGASDHEFHDHHRLPDHGAFEPGPGWRNGSHMNGADDIVPIEHEVAERAQGPCPIDLRVRELAHDHGGPDRVQPKSERRHDPEVPAAAAQSPQQFGLVGLAYDDHRSVGEHHLGGQEIVAGEAEPSRQVAVSTTESQTPHARVRYHAGRSRQAEALRLRVHVPEEGAARNRGGAGVGIHVDLTHAREVDYDAPVRRRSPRDTVTPRPDGHLDICANGQRDRGRHVLCTRAPGDDTGTLVHHGVPYAPSALVSGSAGASTSPLSVPRSSSRKAGPTSAAMDRLCSPASGGVKVSLGGTRLVAETS